MSQPEERRLVREYYSALPPGRLLDAPCGRRWLGESLAAQGFECHAGDLFAPPAEVPGVTCHRLDLNHDLPFADGWFDYVACIEGVEHIESTPRLLRELARVLRPGGQLLVTTPNILSVKSRVRFLLRGRYDGFPHLYRDVPPGEHAHINPTSLPSLDFAARRAGLRRDRVLPYPIRPKNRWYAPAACLLIALNRIELAVGRQAPEYAELLATLASPTLLLSETLAVVYRKPLPSG